MMIRTTTRTKMAIKDGSSEGRNTKYVATPQEKT